MKLRRGTRRQRSAHPAWISRLRERSREERGVAIVEAAFVTPVFFMLIFGILEIGLAMNDHLALASTVRAGSRAASAMGNDTKSDLYTVLGVARESTAIDKRNIVRVVVYKPAGFGEEPTASCKAGTPSLGVCNVYTASDFAKARIQVTEETAAAAENRPIDVSKVTFGCRASGPSPSPDRFWCPTSRRVALRNPSIPGYLGPDYVGVWIRVNHPTVTGLLGTLTLEDHSVIRLEPRSE